MAVLLLIVGVYFIRNLDFLDPVSTHSKTHTLKQDYLTRLHFSPSLFHCLQDGFTSNKPEVADFMVQNTFSCTSLFILSKVDDLYRCTLLILPQFI